MQNIKTFVLMRCSTDFEDLQNKDKNDKSVPELKRLFMIAFKRDEQDKVFMHSLIDFDALADDTLKLKTFLETLEAPICFIAYYGDKFHFPVFMNYLKQMECEKNINILTADVAGFFREKLNQSNININKDLENIWDHYNKIQSSVNYFDDLKITKLVDLFVEHSSELIPWCDQNSQLEILCKLE